MPWIRSTVIKESEAVASARVAEPSPSASDAALAAAARNNPAAFVPLYERHVTQVYRYCFFKLGQREAAEDATSQVFLEALRDIGHFRGQVFAGWLFRIAQHTVADALRRDRRARGNVPLDSAGELTEASSNAGDLDDTAIAVRVALETLPDDLRLTLELQLAGWTSEQIGAALGRSPSAVRMARARGLKQLRATLGDPAAEGGRPW
jgi:RNA polymerase sigma-70 factor (ECF subfamily)